MKNYILTSESVTEGHPDKICDLIADTILDEALKQDPDSKMAVEATIKDDFILIYGEANTKASINYEKIAKDTIKRIGYDEIYQVLLKVNNQSPEITNAIKNQKAKEVGAGDQGIMFGFACTETDVLMPAPIYYAHKLAIQLNEIRKKYSFLKPDGKTQVSVEYENNEIKRIDTIVISIQHSKDVEQEQIRKIVLHEVITACIDSSLLDQNTKYLINPSGSFILGGSFGDSGTTGRKIACDTYGGIGRIGGGCLSSKDASKVDRSATYYCRYVAKNIIANNLARRFEIQVSYAIGKSLPISISINTFGTSSISDNDLLRVIHNNFNFEVGNIISELDLKKPIYAKTSCYGHFGRNDFPWEKIKSLNIDLDIKNKITLSN